jgi:glucose-6-phosphate isomerase
MAGRSSSSSSNNCSTTSTSTSTTCTATQAWAILKRHARDEISHLRLIELCQDNDRVSSLVTIYNASPQSRSNSMLMIDLSRQRMTIETVNHLLRLASSRGIAKFIRRLSWGPNNADNPILPSRLRHINNRVVNNHIQQKQNENENETNISIPSYHMALRVPSGRNLEMFVPPDGTNVLIDIHNNWDRIKRISESLRRGKLPGVTGGMIRDVVVVGCGLAPIMALRFTYLALCKDEAATIGRRVGMDIKGKGKQQRRIKFLTTVDPVRAASLVADSDPASTLVISIALAGEEEATMLATSTLHTWLLVNLGGQVDHKRSDVILSKHTMMVTGNKELAAKNKTETLFLIPDHCCEPYTTFTSASILPLSIVFGWPTVEAFLAGGHDIDSHFVETNPRHNLPVLLALSDIWNDCLQQQSSSNNSTSTNINAGRIVTPYTEAFCGYPSFVAALESQTCGRKRQNSSSTKKFQQSTSSCCSSMVIDGGLHGIYDQSLYQASKVTPSELIMTLDSQLGVNGSLTSSQQQNNNQKGGIEEIHQAQDALIVSLFAHADGLAFGSDYNNNDHNNNNHDDNNENHFTHNNSTYDDDPYIGKTGGDGRDNIDGDGDGDDGNRPSTLLLCSRLDAFTCGQLVAMAEHRAVVKSWIWGIDPFPRGVETRTMLRSKRTESLKESLQNMISNEDDEEEDDETLNLSTKTILRHYANMVRGQRTYSR